MFKVGQKVVCVETARKEGVGIYKDEIYTCGGEDKFFKGEMIILEIPHPTAGYWCAPFKYFRPIDHSFGENLASEIEQEINEEQLVCK